MIKTLFLSKQRNLLKEVEFVEVGNINTMSLHNIWNSEEYQLFRDRVKDFLFSPCIKLDYANMD